MKYWISFFDKDGERIRVVPIEAREHIDADCQADDLMEEFTVEAGFEPVTYDVTDEDPDDNKAIA